MLTIPPTMRALVLREYSGPRAIALEEVPTPRPGNVELLIKVAAAPINPSDLSFLEGQYGVKPELPHGAGFEGSGVVVAAGRGLYGQALVGRRVAFTSFQGGTWAEYCVSPVTGSLPLLPNLNTFQGAMLFVNPFTAWALIDIARRQNARAVVQTAAASALGRMIVRLAQRFDLPVINIVRRQEQVEQLRALGADHVLNSTEDDFDKRLRQLCKELRATVAFDAVAGEMPGRLLRAMPRHSTAYVYGGLSQAAVQINPGDLIFRDQRVGGFYLGAWIGKQPVPQLLRVALSVQKLLAGELRSEVRACLPLEQYERALDLYANDMTGGKVLFVPGIGHM